MDEPVIRIEDLETLAGLMPMESPPASVAAVARWAVELGRGAAPREDDGGAAPVSDFVIKVAEDRSLPDLIPLTGARFVRSFEPVDAPAENAATAAQAEDVPVDAPATAAEPPPQPEPAPEKPLEKSPSLFVRWTAEDDERLLSMYAEGRRLAEIAEALGRTPKAVDVRRKRIEKTDPRAKPAVKGSAAAASAQAVKRVASKPAPKAAAARPDAVADLVGRMAALDDNFEPSDDKELVDRRYMGFGFADIAEKLGCDEDTAKVRWRAILKCGVASTGGIVTAAGWKVLRAAAAARAEAAAAGGEA